ncbi:tetratricopeptide repeat protein [Candidatus Poribacteria bacterium]|nr:tetratricopeptide repeat protein [Candidatus Poribacteria bacterium]MBT7098575.1 tetratricopeptide repeat protein [Candidatus Poribacteria bacterium]
MLLCLGAADASTRRALSRAEIALRQKDYPEAHRNVDEAIARAPLHAPAHVQLGILYLRQGELHDAAASLTRATELDPESFSARYHLGLARLRLGDLDTAHGAFSRAVRLAVQQKAEHPLAYYHLGMTLSRQQKYADAADAFRAAVDLDADMPSPYYQWANVELRRGNREDGRALLAKFRSVKAQKRIRQAISRARQGNSDRALQLLERALEMDREHPSAFHVLALLAFSEGRWDDAIRHARRYVTLRPGADDMQVILGAALRRVGNAGAAMGALSNAIQGAADHPEARYELGEAFLLADNAENAARSLKQAGAKDPTFYQAAYRLGTVLLDLDRPAEAAGVLRGAIAQYPQEQAPSDDMLHGGNVPRLVRAALPAPTLEECRSALSDALKRAAIQDGARP